MNRPRTHRLLGTLFLATSIGALAAPVASAAPAVEAAAKAPLAFGASAWGSTIAVAPPLASSGKTAYVSLGCTQSSSRSRENASAGAELDGLADLGAVTSTVSSSKTAGSTFISTGRSTTAASSLLAGAIQIGAIDAVATATKTGDGFSASTAVTIASLSVNGVDVALTGEQQQVDVPGIAEITVARQQTAELSRQSRARITAVTVRLLDSGAVIKLGEARASIDGRNIMATFTGGAYGSTVAVGAGRRWADQNNQDRIR